MLIARSTERGVFEKRSYQEKNGGTRVRDIRARDASERRNRGQRISTEIGGRISRVGERTRDYGIRRS